MEWVRKKARLRSWRIGLGLGLVGERRNYNCIHYYLDRCKKTPPPKKKYIEPIGWCEKKNESKLCVCSKKVNDNHKRRPRYSTFFFRTQKEKKTYFKKLCSWNSFRKTLSRTKRDFTFQISFVDRVEKWFLSFSLFTKKRLVSMFFEKYKIEMRGGYRG